MSFNSFATVSNIKLFINKNKWKGINYASKIDDWKTFEKNNATIALNILYIKRKAIFSANILKINSTCKKQMILLMITNEKKEGWHDLTIKKPSTSLRRITSKRHGDFYYLNRLNFLEQRKNLNLIKKYVKIKIFVEL